MEYRTIEAKLHLSRPTEMRGNIRRFDIEVEDPHSGIEYVTITVNPDDLGLLLHGEYTVPCRVAMRGLDLVGRRHETQRVNVAGLTRQTWADRDRIVADVCADLIADGWKPDGWRTDGTTRGEGYNGHHQKGDTYEIILRRYVADGNDTVAWLLGDSE